MMNSTVKAAVIGAVAALLGAMISAVISYRAQMKSSHFAYPSWGPGEARSM
jgi:hypothetical protein